MFRDLHPFAQYLFALAATVGVYGGYAALVAPRLEGPPPEMHVVAGTGQALPDDDDQKRMLRRWLPEGSWELGDCKSLRTGDAVLYFRDYVTGNDGTVQVVPLTVILQGGGAEADGKPPVIVRATERAELTFDRPLELGGAGPGRLLQGRLPGPVDLFQPPGPDQPGTLVRTSNLQLTPRRVFTLDHVEFTHGGSQGSGRNLVLDLAHSAPPGAINTGFASVNGLSRLELAFVDFVELAEQPDGVNPRQVAEESLRSARILCRGPFVYDFQAMTASFREQVVVRATDGTGDNLAADLLEVFFARTMPAGPGSGTSATRPVAGLKPDRVVASGRPVQLDLVSRGASAVAESLEYDLGLSRIRASDTRAVVVRQAGQEFVARGIEYRVRNDRTLGPLVAAGPGRVTARGEGESELARWTVSFASQLTIEPEENRRVVTMDGDARMEMGGQQSISARQIRLWLEMGKDPPQAQGTANGALGGGEARPVRLEASERVQMVMDQVSGVADRLLVAWPEGNEVSRAMRPGRQAGPNVANFELPIMHRVARPMLAGSAPQSVAAPRGVSFRGEAVSVRMVQAGQAQEVGDVEISGNVLVEQRGGQGGEELALQVRGDRLRLVPQGENLWQADVAGNARVDAGALALRGGRLQLDQASNRVWVPGPGQLDLTAQSGRPDSVTVTWQGGMIFDGNRVWFEQQVRPVATRPEAEGGQSVLRAACEGMTLTLDRAVSLRDDANGQGGQPQVRRMLMAGRLSPGQQAFPAAGPAASGTGAIVLDKSGTDATGKIISRQLLVVPTADFDVASGDLQAAGPGGLVHWQPAGKSATGSIFDRGSEPAATTEGGISCLHVNFDGRLRASSARRELDLEGNVRAVFGPARDWETQLQPDRQPPATGMTRLTCQQVSIVQWTPQSSDGPLSELVAMGDATIVGETFEARGQRISYNQQTDLLVLEGDGRDDANLWHAARPGASRDHLVAGKILYRPGDQWTQIEKVRSATMNRTAPGSGR